MMMMFIGTETLVTQLDTLTIAKQQNHQLAQHGLLSVVLYLGLTVETCSPLHLAGQEIVAKGSRIRID